MNVWHWWNSSGRGNLKYLKYTRFVQKVSGLTTAHEVDKAYRVLTLMCGIGGIVLAGEI